MKNIYMAQHCTSTILQLQKEMATHSGILAWRIPRTEEPGGRQSRGSHRAGHGCTHLHDTAAFRGKQDSAGDESSV